MKLPNDIVFVDSFPVTPLVPVHLSEDGPLIWCKMEFCNPSGSTKDRIARKILEKAWRQGKIQSGSLVIEASSGSTSIAMAFVCAQLSLRFCAIMPEGVTKERIALIKAYGAEVVLTPKSEGMRGALAHAERLTQKTGCFYTRQFENPDSAEAHYLGTGQEILLQIPGAHVDALVCGVGTGGTIMGLYRAFFEAGCKMQTYVARPVTGDLAGGADCSSFSNRIPGVLDNYSKLYVPEKMPFVSQISIEDKLAVETAQRLIRKGFPVGPSSGLNFAAAERVAHLLGNDAKVVTVFPDRMERYFSTDLFCHPIQ